MLSVVLHAPFAWQGPPDGLNADKRTGLLARQSGDTLYQYRVLTTGALSCLAQIGVGWDAMTSIIGMSDHNGDRRGDVVAVRSDGILWLYAGRGGGDVLSGKRSAAAGAARSASSGHQRHRAGCPGLRLQECAVLNLVICRVHDP